MTAYSGSFMMHSTIGYFQIGSQISTGKKKKETFLIYARVCCNKIERILHLHFL